jgi:membrane protease YdiL (CAAX protease family)
MARKDLSTFGLSMVNVKNDMKAIAICIVPVIALAIALFAIGWKSWEGALLVSAIEVLILFLIGKLLANVPAGDGKAVMSTLALAVILPFGMVGGIAASFIYYFALVGPAEELLFRGYIQSRLNEAFGRPYRFFGVSWGAGIIVASMLFGLWHVLNPFNPITGDFSLAWQWGLWTFFLGLIFGLIREKTNGLSAPAILHGALNFF